MITKKLFFLILFAFIRLEGSCLIACITRNIAEFEAYCDNNDSITYSSGDMIVFLEEMPLNSSFEKSEFEFINIGLFSSVVGKYDYVLIVRPDFFIKESLLSCDNSVVLCGKRFNVIHIGSYYKVNTTNCLEGNIYFSNFKKIALINDLEQISNLKYQTIYEVSYLKKHLLGKSTFNIYALEIILQTCLFYNRIMINEKCKAFRFPSFANYI